MISWMLAGAAAVSALVVISSGQNVAFACNRTAGCTTDVQLEDYQMKRDGRMDEALRAGRDNAEAFRKLQAAEERARRANARR
jgi:hypothetical protein